MLTEKDFPATEEIAAEIANLTGWWAPEPDGEEDQYLDVRLQVEDGGSWSIHTGSAQYDTSHLGFWGASSIPADLTAAHLREIAKDLREEAIEDAYQAGEWDEKDASAPFWHPDLPKVQSVGAVGVFAMTTRSVTPSWPFGTWRKVAAFAALLLCALSLPAFAQEPCKVNVNTASPAQLALLIQTGPVLAGKIAAARTAGPLDADKLDAVPGVGVKWLEYNSPHVTYSGETTCNGKLKKPAAMPEGKTDGPKPEAAGGGR